MSNTKAEKNTFPLGNLMLIAISYQNILILGDYDHHSVHHLHGVSPRLDFIHDPCFIFSWVTDGATEVAARGDYLHSHSP